MGILLARVWSRSLFTTPVENDAPFTLVSVKQQQQLTMAILDKCSVEPNVTGYSRHETHDNVEQATLFLASQCVHVVAEQDDIVDERCVIGHANATILGSVFWIVVTNDGEEGSRYNTQTHLCPPIVESSLEFTWMSERNESKSGSTYNHGSVLTVRYESYNQHKDEKHQNTDDKNGHTNG